MTNDINVNEKNLDIKSKSLFTVKILPWFMGLSNDLIFYVSISILFLTTVKGLNASQITFITTISGFAYIILQKPFLKIIQRIGNIKSIRIGTAILLLASIILTFAKTYFIIIIGEILYSIAFLFKSMDNVILKNNLVYLRREHEYIVYKNKSNLMYSIITAIITLCAGYFFKINYYLPMYFCIGISIINFLLSFILTDIKIIDKVDEEDIISRKEKVRKSLILIMISYAIFFATITTGKTNIKLFMEHQFTNKFGVGQTAVYFSYILLITQITRIFCNLHFLKIYIKIKNKVLYYLPLVCLIAFQLVILGGFIELTFLKTILMTIGLCIIFGVKDIFNTYIYDFVLKNSKHNERQACISYLGLSKKIGEIGISLLLSLLLLKFDLIYIILILLMLCFLSFLINYEIYYLLNTKNEKNNVEMEEMIKNGK